MPTLPQLSSTASRRFRLLAALAVAVVALVVIWKLLAVLLPFLLSGAVAYLLLPLVNAAERRTPLGRRWPGPTRMVTAALLLLLVILAVLIVVAVGVFRLIDESTALVERAPDLVVETQAIYRAVITEYENRVPPNIREMLAPRLDDLRVALTQALNDALHRLFGVLQTGVGLVVSLATVPIILFYLLFDPAGIGRGVRRLLPRSLRDDLCEIARLSGESIGVYMRVQLLLGAMIAVITGLVLWLMGVPLAPVLAIVAFVGELVPIVGPTISLIIAAIVTLVTDWTKAPLVIAFYLVLQALQNTLIAPRMQGQALGLHPLAVILALAIFGLFLGFWGVLVAAPFTAAGYRVLSYVVGEWDAAAHAGASPDEAVPGDRSSISPDSAESAETDEC